MKHLLLLLAYCTCVGTVTAQAISDSLRQTTHATLLGIGGVHHLDTYLSPQTYSGLQLHFLRESLRRTRLAAGRISFQSLVHAEASITSPSADNANDLGGTLSYDATWHYNWQVGDFRLMAGPQVGGTIGILYNTRNGNNPAQAIAKLNLSASLAAIYGFRLWGHHFSVRDQLDLPLLGAMFSPAYGQSYYEIFSLRQYDHNIRCTHPFNAPSLRNQLTLDFPLRNHTFRIGYLIDIRQSHVNDIRCHSYTHAFLIGWVRHFTRRKHRQAMQEGFIL